MTIFLAGVSIVLVVAIVAVLAYRNNPKIGADIDKVQDIKSKL